MNKHGITQENAKANENNGLKMKLGSHISAGYYVIRLVML